MSRTFASIPTTFAALAVMVIVILALVVARPANLFSGSAANVDPLTRPAAIQFRQSEHADTAYTADPLILSALVDFRRTEHSEAAVSSTDRLEAPSLVQFRQSEHSEQ